jgi:oxazoline/thiazoline dehydrogenase
MLQAYVLSFAEGVTVDAPSADRIVIEMPVTYRQYTFKGLSPGLRQAIEVLSSNGATEDELARLVQETDGMSSLARLYYYLLIFAERRILSYGIFRDGRSLAILAPTSGSFIFSPASVDPQSRYTLSRFAYLHRERKDLILECPLAHGKITLHGWEGAAVAAGLAKPRTLGSLCDLLQGIPRDAVALFLEMFFGAGFVSELKPDEPYPGESEALTQWEFHDLLFHVRSRMGRHTNPLGGTYRFYTKIEPLPAVKKFDARETIDLYRPDMSTLELEDFPFTVVLEERRSIREYGERPITDRQLGEFLYRSARVKELMRMEFQELSSRPYPGAGAIYELELYISVRSCENLSPGLYHYCPKNHRLEKICGLTEAVDTLLKDAVGSAGIDEMPPQVLITIAARFQRLSWKYESLAYSVLLKDVGVLYQTMYLVATAMDLAPCAIGGGDSDLFARAAGLDYFAETSVGEFLLGSKRI